MENELFIVVASDRNFRGYAVGEMNTSTHKNYVDVNLSRGEICYRDPKSSAGNVYVFLSLGVAVPFMKFSTDDDPPACLKRL